MFHIEDHFAIFRSHYFILCYYLAHFLKAYIFRLVSSWQSTITGLDWTGGLDWWTGLVDWTGGLDWWIRLVDWTGGLDWWTRLVD